MMHRHTTRRLLIGLAVMLGLSIATTAPAEPASEPTATADLDRLLEQLAATDYRARAAAQERLFDLSDPQKRRLGEIYQTASDPEVKMRLHLFARSYFERYVLPEYPELQRPGFLGVSQSVEHTPQGPIIRVVGVISGSGAEAAGVKPGDGILALNGKRVDPNNPVGDFGQRVKDAGAGATVDLKLERDGKPITLEATLGPLPDHLVNNGLNEIEMKIRRLRDHWFEQAFLEGKLRLGGPVDWSKLLADAEDLAPRAENNGVRIQGNVQIRGNIQIIQAGQRIQIQGGGGQ